MKKFQTMACVAMLTSAIAFTGCKSNDEPAVNGQKVTTDITISLPTQVGDNDGVFRMPGVNVQTSGVSDFTTNGMKGITLVPFGPSAAVTTSSTRIGDNIVLGTISEHAKHTENAKAGAGRTVVFEGESVPQGTSAFLFYGESNTSEENLFAKGALTATLTGEPSAFNFALNRIVLNASAVTGNAAYTGLIDYLNSVANATNGVKAWKNYTSSDNEGLYQLFQTYKTAKVLSSFGIRRMMEDLYKSLMSNTSDPMATAIKTAIANNTYASVDGSGNLTLVEGLRNFPQSLGLPAGAIAVAYNNDLGTLAFVGSAAAPYGDLSTTSVDSYVYPASLWYFANSKIKTSNTSEKEHYVAGASWKDILAQYANDNASVSTLTRSIAIKDTIQYAVARLDVKVKTKENNYLLDNDPVEANNRVANPLSGYRVKAVLVGGQKNVGFDFTPETYSGAANSFTLYDSIMTANMYTQTGSYSAVNSTLVLESEEGDEKDVYVAIELINDSQKDFYGADGIVPVGGRFYLVGKLTSAASTVKDAELNTIKRVFIQDYTTTAAFSIADLKHAYSTIPDLRSPSLEIGMAVDLTWQKGTTYEVEL